MVCVCACIHACACVPHCECVSGWWTCTFTCINMYYLDAGEAMATRFYNRLTVFGHHEVCTPSRKMCMHIPHLYTSLRYLDTAQDISFPVSMIFIFFKLVSSKRKS